MPGSGRLLVGTLTVLPLRFPVAGRALHRPRAGRGASVCLPAHDEQLVPAPAQASDLSAVAPVPLVSSEQAHEQGGREATARGRCVVTSRRRGEESAWNPERFSRQPWMSSSWRLRRDRVAGLLKLNDTQPRRRIV